MFFAEITLAKFYNFVVRKLINTQKYLSAFIGIVNEVRALNFKKTCEKFMPR